jgi:hypothetical protein
MTSSRKLASRIAAASTFGPLVLALLLAFPEAHAETPPPNDARFGVLFYSPAERAAIVRARRGEAGEDQNQGNGKNVSNLATLDGVVKRERGKGTLWINREAIPEGQSPPSLSTSVPTAAGAAINGKRVRVGESLDLSTGERSDIVPDGTVSVRRP